MKFNQRTLFPTSTGLKLSVVIICLIPFLAPGCKPGATSSTSGANGKTDPGIAQKNPDLDGKQILERMKATYSSAKSYRDEAILRLSYRLLGNYLEEPHQWAVEFQRPGELRASVYNARLRADGGQMGCFVYDFGSSNLGNQWLVHKANQTLPIGKFTRDPICRHYLAGLADLPVDVSNPSAGELFIPPQISLLMGEGEVAWLEGNATRIGDRMIADRACYQVAILQQGAKFLAAVDCETFLLRELHFPAASLDPRLANSSDVADLQIVAEFRNATLDPPFPEGHFSIEMPPQAIPVNQFVKVPEKFPSSFVGKLVELAGLIELNGVPVDRKRWKGKVVFLGWTSNMLFDERWNRTIADLAETLPVEDFIVATVYTAPGAGPGSDVLKGLNTSVSTSSRAMGWVDPSFVAGNAIGLESFPVFAILNRDGVLQYVGNIEESASLPSLEELKTILHRVRSGDDVAGEMRTEYGKFLEEYETRLAASRIDGNRATNNGILPQSMPATLSLRKLWENRDLRQPGNISCSPGSDDLLVVDGWRTMVRLPNEGKNRSEVAVPLPARESITVARPSSSGDRVVTFSVAGRHVHILDQESAIVGRVYQPDGEARVRDARLADLDGDGKEELYVAWTASKGVTRHLPGEAGDWPETVVFDESWRDSCLLKSANGPDRFLVCNANTRLASVKSDANGVLAGESVQCSLESCVRVAAGIDPNGESIACVIGTDRLGGWHVALLDAALKEIATHPIGPQNHITQIEPVAYARMKGLETGFWAIAGSDGTIRLIQENGLLNETWSVGQSIDGLTLISSESAIVAVVSTDQSVQAFELSTPAARN
jgi:hypothetical protein